MEVLPHGEELRSHPGRLGSGPDDELPRRTAWHRVILGACPSGEDVILGRVAGVLPALPLRPELTAMQFGTAACDVALAGSA